MAKFHFPTWKGWLLINPMRLLFQNPAAILGHLVKPGMTILDLGCSMGYFSLPLAQMAGPQGRVVCLDSDERQLNILRRRAVKRGLLDQMEIRRVDPANDDLDLGQYRFDLAILLQVLHYMDNPLSALMQTRGALKTGSVILVGEPKSHLSEEDWRATVKMITQAGFECGQETAMYNLRFIEAKK